MEIDGNKEINGNILFHDCRMFNVLIVEYERLIAEEKILKGLIY